MICPDHDPCCSSHGVPMSCERYRRTHFVEIRPCCAIDAARLREESQNVNEGSPEFPRGIGPLEWPDVPRHRAQPEADLYASRMESTRTQIEARHCQECGKTTPHEVHYMLDRSPAGVTRREIGEGCTRCQETAE